MKEQLIVTHSGGAHFDEVTAISLIMAMHTDAVFRVERRDPLQAELDNPEVWVVDIGGRHEPKTRNFDHHQDINCSASFVLVAEYLGLVETLSIMPWWQFKDSVDRFGPVKSSEIYNAGDDLVNRSPVESWLMARFASDTAEMLPLLKYYGIHMIESARILKKQVDFWKTSTRLVIAGVPVAIGETRELAGLEEFRRLDKNPPDIIISLDRVDKGWRLFRFEGAPVDFTLISDRPEIAFAHKNGFLAKTRETLPIDDLIPLVGRAVTRS